MALFTSPCVVGFSGYKHVGKTTLIAALTERFAARGVRVGTIKHDVHGFSGSPEATDTAKFARAGAVSILIADASGHYAVERYERATPTLQELIRLLGEVDLVLIEGFKYEPFPKWIVLGENDHSEEGYRVPDYFPDIIHACDILGAIVPRPPLSVVNLDLPVYDRNDLDAITLRIDQLLFTK